MAKVLKKTASFFKAIVDVLLPPVCYVCGKSCSSKYGLCDFCLDKIRPIPSPHCAKCGKRVMESQTICAECGEKKSLIERGWSCCYYKDTIKECIHLFKYNRYIGLMDIFRDIMLDFIKKNEIRNMVDLLVPVPVHPAKKRERAYNHAEVLARALSAKLSIPCDSKSLKKIRWTQSQSELDREGRLKNVKDSFLAVEKAAFSGRNVLLIDDVYTTGATISECAKAVKDADAKKVFYLTLARGVS